MLRRLGDGYLELLRQYHSIVGAEVTGHGGKTVATEGDGLCVFSSPVDAVDAARDILVAMRHRDWVGSERPFCRIGIHTGTATQTPELGAAEIAREASGHAVVPWLQPMLEQAQMSTQLALEDAYEDKLAAGRSSRPARPQL